MSPHSLEGKERVSLSLRLTIVLMMCVGGLFAALIVLQPENRRVLLAFGLCSLLASALALTPQRSDVSGYSPQIAEEQIRLVAIIVPLMLAGYRLLSWAAASLISDDQAITIIKSLTVHTLWIGLPVTLFCLGVVKWPDRLSTPGFLIPLLGWVLVAYILIPVFDTAVSNPLLALDLALRATGEEIVFRVILLTAILSATRSPLAALVISSVCFGLGHIPANIARITDFDVSGGRETYWPLLPTLVLMHIGVGVVLGALWLRTGSVALIIAAHAIFNLNNTSP